MAAPQTHLVVTGLVRIIILKAFKRDFSIVEWISCYFWGFGLDLIDHFTSLSYVKDIPVRIRRFLKGGDLGGPSKGVKIPICWLHLWPGFLLVLLYGAVFNRLFDSFLIWIPLLFWLSHKLLDDYQKNDESAPSYYSFFHPWRPKWARKRGYPIKSRIEIMIFSPFAVLVLIFEFIWLIKRIF